MTKTTIANVARKMTDCELMSVARALNAELESAMGSGERATQAHIGRIELAEACSAELWSRGYGRGAKRDGSDLPRQINTEDGLRYCISVNCL